MSDRQLWVLAHRYVGLVLAGFLIISGVTGSLMAFFEELESASIPALTQVHKPAGVERLDVLAIRERLITEHPDWSIEFVDLRIKKDSTLRFFVSGASDDEIFVDPYSGEIVGSRKWGDISQGMRNLLPFVYQLHYSLAAGVVGTYAFGIIALLWTLDCFVGFYLTFPRNGRRDFTDDGAASRTWWSRWKAAWKVRWSAGSYKFNFDLHRAGGLWMWALLLVFAWSSVAFNLREVYNPVMRMALDLPDEDAALPPLSHPRHQPKIGWREGLQITRSQLAQLARGEDFSIREEVWFGYEPAFGLYSLSVNSTRDVGTKLPRTQMWVDGDTGKIRHVRLPTGVHGGETVTTWLYALHMGKVWGLPYRIFVCLFGLLVATLSITGVVIWWRKRRAKAPRTSNLTDTFQTRPIPGVEQP
jgi:uncharacterized iron-regulated membrane protein